MPNYRIKVRELNSGKKEYIPQYREKRNPLSLIFKNRKWEWQNICYDNIYRDFFVSDTMTQIFDTEEKALDLIRGHKQQLENQRLKEISKVSYKEIEP